MKIFLKSLTFIPIFLLLVNNLAGANIHSKDNRKWDSLNGLKNIHSHLMRNGHIVRLEFKKPVVDWVEPVFYEKSLQIDFPGAFVSPSKKNFIAKSSLISKVFATQFNNKTLRIRLHIKPGGTDIEKRFKLASQGRFMIIRFDSSPETNDAAIMVCAILLLWLSQLKTSLSFSALKALPIARI